MKETEDSFSISYLSSRADWTNGFIPDFFRPLSWDRLRASTAACADIVQAVKDFTELRTSGLQGGSVVLFGKAGMGKSLLSAVAFKHLAPFVPDRQREASFKDAGTLDNVAWHKGEELAAIWKGDEDESLPVGYNRMRHMETARLLVLDDLDKAVSGPTWNPHMFRLIDERLQHPERITFITMNRNPRTFSGRFDTEDADAVLNRIQRASIIVHLQDEIDIIPGSSSILSPDPNTTDDADPALDALR